MCPVMPSEPRRATFQHTLLSPNAKATGRHDRIEVDVRLPRPGDVLVAKYRIERVIGEGAMGVVYAAHHELLDMPVALKMLHPDAVEEESIVRFLHEAKVCARIRSEHVCAVVDVGLLDEGTPYLAMELLHGTDLANVLARKRRLPLETAIDYCLQALDGLEHAHAAGAVHRDLKPTNLFLHTPEGGGREVLKVIDFGVCKSDLMLGMTRVGAFIGSPYYMSPEQIMDAARVDGRTDVWSIGVVLYEMLAGAMPFEGETMAEVVQKILEDAPAALLDRRPDLPRELSAIVNRCLRRSPDERYATAGELARALAPYGSSAAAGASDFARAATLPMDVRAPTGAAAGPSSVPPVAMSPSTPPPPAPGAATGTSSPPSMTPCTSSARVPAHRSARRSWVLYGAASAAVAVIVGVATFGVVDRVLPRTASTGSTGAAAGERAADALDTPPTSAVEGAPATTEKPRSDPATPAERDSGASSLPARRQR